MGAAGILHHSVSRAFRPFSIKAADKPLELTLGILKPDLAQHRQNLQQVRELIVENNFIVVRSKMIKLNRARAEQFYAEHRGRFFFNRLVTFMSSGPCQPLILAKVNAIQSWRDLMGPTKVFQSRYSHPESIRGRYGLTDTRNSSHGSDSTITAKQEMEFFFPEFDAEEFYLKEEALLRRGDLTFDPDLFIHKPNS